MCFLGFIYGYSEPDHMQGKFGRKLGSSWFLQADWGDPQSSFSTLSLKVWDSDLWIMNQCFMQTVPLMSEDDLVSSLDLSRNIRFPKFFRKYKCSIPLQWRCEIDLRLVLRPGLYLGVGGGRIDLQSCKMFETIFQRSKPGNWKSWDVCDASSVCHRYIHQQQFGDGSIGIAAVAWFGLLYFSFHW